MDEKHEKVLEACNRILDLAPEGTVDDFARRNLKSELVKYESVNSPTIARVEFAVDKHKTDGLLVSLADEETPAEVGLSFTGMSLDPVWEYDTPTRRLKAEVTGKGGVLYFLKKRSTSGVSWDPMSDIITEKAMVFLYTSKWFFPETLKNLNERPADTPPPKPHKLLSFFQWWDDVRSSNIIPFEIVVCAYTKTNRFMYTMDIVNNFVLIDFRNGAFSRKRLERDPLDFLYLDRVLACNVLKEIQKKILIYSFEVDSVSASEIAFGFHITEQMAQNHLRGIVNRGIMSARGEGLGTSYVVNFDFLQEKKGEIFG